MIAQTFVVGGNRAPEQQSGLLANRPTSRCDIIILTLFMIQISLPTLYYCETDQWNDSTVSHKNMFVKGNGESLISVIN